MPSFTWSRDALTLLSRTRAATSAPDPLRRAMITTILRSGYTPPPGAQMRAAAARSLETALGYGPDEARRAADQFAATMYRAGLLLFDLRLASAPSVDAFLEREQAIDGWENLVAALSAGPVILFSGHFGLPAAAALGIARRLRGQPRLNTFFAPPDENPMTAGYAELFAKVGYGINCIPAGSRAPVAALRALRTGEILTMQPDVYDNRRGSAVLVPFLGGLTYMMTGTAFLALRSGAALLPTYCAVKSDGTLQLRIDPPLTIPLAGDADRDAYRVTAAICASLEREIRSQPEQWVYWPTLAERMVPGISFPRDGACDASVWRGALESLLPWAARNVPAVVDAVHPLRLGAAQ